MSFKNGLPELVRLSATLASTVNATSPVVLGGDIVSSIQKASALGYDAVELHWSDPALIDLSLVEQACKSNDMVISAFATGRAYVQEGLSLIDDDENRRKAALKRLLHFVDAAAPYNATVIIGCMRGNLPQATDVRPYLDRLAASVRLAADYAADKGVQIVIEVINRYENNYLNTAAQTMDFIKAYNLKNTRILLDTFHMNIEDSDMSEAIHSCGDLLGYVHVADSNRCFAGAGHINLNKIIKALISIDYKGFISAECLPIPDSDTALTGWILGIKAAF